MRNLSLLLFVSLVTISGKVVAQSIPSYVPSKGLVGWWPFSGNANDSSGNKNHGIVNGATLTSDRFGSGNSAYHFNNIGSIQAGQIQLKNYVSSGFTISYWFTMEDSTSKARHFLFTNYDGINGLQIECGSDTVRTLRHSLRTGSAKPPETQLHGSFSIFNTWKHAVIVWSPPNMLTYINGVLTNQSNASQITNLAVCCNVKSRFGSQWNSKDNHKGKLDDIGIWNRALTSQEVIGLFNSLKCANDLKVSPSINTSTTSSNVVFSANTSDSNASIIWQSDFGQGFQSLKNFGAYSGTETNTLKLNYLGLENHLQEVRAISSSQNCVDTSNIGLISLTDTCIQTRIDTNIITINDTNIVVVTDTNYVVVADTNYVTDTSFIVVTDTNYIAVTDTLIINTTLGGTSSGGKTSRITVFPNPARTHITLDFGDYKVLKGCRVNIVDAVGKTVYASQISAQQVTLNIAGWNGKGIYYLWVYDVQNNIIGKGKILVQ